jgi:RNA polymerase sigma-70 factor (ECF subfamily)
MSGDGAAPESSRPALSQVLIQEGDRLYALALRVTRDPDLAADAVQEAFASALEKQAGFRGDARPSTWLHRIVFNKSVDLLRRRRREEALPEDEPAELTSDDERLAHSPSWRTSPEALAQGAEVRAAVEEALATLSPLQRAVFELKEAEGRPTDEVAEILGMAPATVRVHLHRARLRLRALLAGRLREGRP